MLLGTLCASLLGNMLARKRVIIAEEGTFRFGYGSKRTSHKKIFLTPSHLLTNFEKQMYYQNEPRFYGVYFRDDLPEAYVINLDEYSEIG